MRLKKTESMPEFRTEAEEADFWGTHDTSELWKSAKPLPPLKMPVQQVKSIAQRQAERKAAISIRLDRTQIEAAKKIAERKSIGYQTQLRIWIAEGIRKEARRSTGTG